MTTNHEIGGSSPSQDINFLCGARKTKQNTNRSHLLTFVLVAQLDKARDYESRDWGFKSLPGLFNWRLGRVVKASD